MKKVLIIAVICLIVGALLVGAGWVLLQKNPIDKNTTRDVVEVYRVSKAPTQIKIDTIESRVEILPIEGDEWRVECKETEKLSHTIDLTDGILTVKQTDNRQWYDYIGILNGFLKNSVTVYLPRGTYELLDIASTSGGIKVHEGFAFVNAELKNTSGSISMASSVEGALTVRNTSGSITVSGGVGGNLTTQNTSGSTRVLGGVNGALQIHSNSGRIEVKDATPTKAEVSNTSGSIYLENVICKESCSIKNTSGSIELAYCDAMSFDVRNTSGSIRASLLSAKTFDCHSVSGGVNTPRDGNGGTFRANSTSGSIRVTVVE